MEKNEVSIQEAKFFVAIQQNAEWSTSRELAEKAGIADRTARAHALKLVRLGLLDVAEVFPAHRYRLSEKANKRNAAYLLRLKHACEVFAL